jgi:hypothetical protein
MTSRLSRSFESHLEFKRGVDRFRLLAMQPSTSIVSEGLASDVLHVWVSVVRAVQGLEQLRTTVKQLASMTELTPQPPGQLADLLHDHHQQGDAYAPRLRALYNTLISTSISFLLPCTFLFTCSFLS